MDELDTTMLARLQQSAEGTRLTASSTAIRLSLFSLSTLMTCSQVIR